MRIRVSACILTVLLAAAAAEPVAAQEWALGRGSIRVGGSASFTSAGQEVNGTESDDRVTELSISPSLQFFVTDGFALGGTVSLLHASGGDQSVTVWGIGPAASYYFGAPDRNVHPFLAGSVEFFRQSRDETDDSDVTGFRGAAGLLFMLSDAVGLSTELFYRQQSAERGNSEFDTNTFGLAIGFSAFLF